MKVKVIIYNDKREPGVFEFYEQGDLKDVNETVLNSWEEYGIFMSLGETFEITRGSDGKVEVKSSGVVDPSCEGVWPETLREEMLEQFEES